MNVDKGMLIL